MRQSVHPIGDLHSAQDLCQRTRKVIAVVVHQVVPIASEFIPQLLHNATHLFGGKVSATDLYALPETELFAQLVMVPGLDLEDARELEGVSSVRVLLAKDLYARVEHTQADRRCVIVDPVL